MKPPERGATTRSRDISWRTLQEANKKGECKMEDFRVNICGVPYKVYHKEDTFDAQVRTYGEIRYKESKINLATGMCPELENQTLIHEIVHGILFHIGRDDLCNDETFVQALAQGMMPSFEVKKV